MPHFTLEYSQNIIEKNNVFTELFKKSHALLTEMLPTQMNSCMSRAVPQEIYYIGDGRGGTVFIHGTLKVKPGRTQETLKKTGEALLVLIKGYFPESCRRLNARVSLELIELPETYF
jgi:5-carboxymethyl-2-hydroxymuconate isomerase